MGMGLALLGGALTGVGAGLTQKATYELDMRRQAALEQMKRESEAIRLQLSGEINDENAARQAARGDFYDAKKGVRDHGFKMTEAGVEIEGRVTLESVKAKNEAALAQLKHQFNMTEDQNKAALDLSNKLALNKQEVGYWDVAKDGSLIAYAKSGNRIGQTGAGIFNPTRQPSREEGGSRYSTTIDPDQDGVIGTPPGGSGPAGATAAAAPSNPNGTIMADGASPRARALAELGTLYASATPQQYPGFFNPDGSKKSLTELRQIIEQRYPQ